MAFYGQLKQTVDVSQQQNSGAFGMVAGAYRGSAYSTDSTRYEKETFDDLVDLSKENKTLMFRPKADGLP